MLFSCLLVAVIVQVLTVVVLCSQGALADETTGRARLHEKDEALAGLRQRALGSWTPQSPAWNSPGGGEAATEARLDEVPESAGWLLNAVVRQAPDVSRWVVSALVERGRDGVDLPCAAVVAQDMTAAPERVTAWVEAAEGSGATPAVCCLGRPPAGAVLGTGCTVASLGSPWGLDAGSLAAVTGAAEGDEGAEAIAADVAPGAGTLCLSGQAGSRVVVPGGAAGRTPAQPLLLVATGGATLDARRLGDLYGVLVVDQGSVELEGTVLHGAVFATGRLEVGETGEVMFTHEILRWATDRSLCRARLVPGSRREGME